MRIIIDAMGGDHAPFAPVAAAAKATLEYDATMVLVGKPDVINAELAKHKYNKDKIEIVEANELITNYEDPAKAVRVKKDASVVVAANLLRKGQGDAMLSMGNTGALLAAGLLIVGRIKGVKRPAIATLLPTKEGPKMLTDAGANTNCKPENLVQFAIMGEIYMRKIMGIEKPRVALLSNGEEEGKGNDLVKETYPLMKKQDFNYIGNAEGRDVMYGNADVFVCEGFAGNLVLKTIEGMGSVVGGLVKGIFMENVFTKLGALFVRKQLTNFKNMLDYREYGGAPLLGTKKPVIKGHGSSDVKAVYSAIRQAIKFVENDVIAEIEKHVEVEEDV